MISSTGRLIGSLFGAALLWGLVGCASAPKAEQEPLVTLRPKAEAPTTQAAADPLAYWKGRADVISLPPVKPAEALTLPTTKVFQLKNGLTVLLVPDRSLPIMSVQLLLPVGSIDDPADKVGLADFTASMLRQGTRRYSADALSKVVDSAGASLSAASGYETTRLACSGRSDSAGLCLQMVADLARRPTFPAKEMHEIQQKLLGAVRQALDDPATLAELHFYNMLYGDDHPAGRPLTKASILNISNQDLKAFFRRAYTPTKAILGVSGQFEMGRVEARIKQLFRAWPRGKAPPRHLPAVASPPRGMKVLLVDKPDLSQAFFTMGHPGIKYLHPHRDAAVVMNYVFGGGGFSSRLMQVVRSQGGKTYGISSHLDMNTDDGSFAIQSFTKNDQLLVMLQMVQKELKRLLTDPPSLQELTAAKGFIAGGYAIRFQTAASITRRMMAARLRGLPPSFIAEFPLRVNRLSLAEVGRAAREHLHPAQLLVAVVGRAAVVGPLLKAANIPFEKISYLAPISGKKRDHPKK